MQIVTFVVTFIMALAAQREAAALPAYCTSSALIPRNSCAFYTECLEAQYPCGDTGYAVGYGLHYCQAFTNNVAKFSPQGQQWISDVMWCLESALVPFLQSTATPPTCQAIKNFAFDSHPQCYVQKGVCQLPFSDWVALAKVIGVRQLFFDLKAIKQEALVAIQCPGQWAHELLHKLFSHL